jgi:hypothetical protein
MARQNNQRADEVLLALLACGATKEAAARQAGVSLSTVKRRLADPDFCRRKQALIAEAGQRMVGAFTAAGPAALQTMVELLKAPASGAVRLGAARAVIELGMKVRETSDFEQRLAALEERMASDGSNADGR